MLQSYKDIISFYNSSEALKKGSLKSYSTTSVLAFKKTSGSSEVLVILNSTDEAVNYDIPAELENTMWKGALDGTDVTLTDIIDLKAYEYRILKK